LVNFVLLFISISFAIVAQILMKHGMIMFGAFPVSQLLAKTIPMVFQPYVFLGILFFGVSSIFWLAVISRIDLSMAYPLVSVAYIVVAIYSYFVFKEDVSPIRWLGIIIICLGVFLISRS